MCVSNSIQRILSMNTTVQKNSLFFACLSVEQTLYCVKCMWSAISNSERETEDVLYIRSVRTSDAMSVLKDHNCSQKCYSSQPFFRFTDSNQFIAICVSFDSKSVSQLVLSPAFDGLHNTTNTFAFDVSIGSQYSRFLTFKWIRFLTERSHK